MDSSLAQAAFRIGCFVVMVSGGLLLFLPNGSAEQAITLLTFVIGLVFLIGVTIAVRLGQREP